MRLTQTPKILINTLDTFVDTCRTTLLGLVYPHVQCLLLGRNIAKFFCTLRLPRISCLSGNLENTQPTVEILSRWSICGRLLLSF